MIRDCTASDRSTSAYHFIILLCAVMASEELSTYFLYSDGIDPSMLNLGAMVLDFKSPKQREPYRHPQLE